YVGKDSVAYTFSCSGIRTAAKVYITVTPLPDNIDEAECFTEAPETVWDIEKKYQSAMTSGERVQSYAQPFVGDLDGDGNVEIVTMNYANSTYMSDRILIFNPDLTLYDSISVPVANSYVTLPLALADVDGDGEGEIIYGSGHRNVASAADQYRLHAFHKDGTPVWKSTESYMDGYSAAHYYSSAITVADLDGDGRVEILAGDRVFAGESGALLATLPAGGRGKHVNASGTTEDGYLPAIGDINRDGIQEIVCGNTTYRVTVNSRTNAAANSVSIVGQINLPDGYTSIADIDGDGILDVVVVGRPNNNDDSQMYAWQGTGTSNNQIGNVVFGSSYAFPSSDAANYVAGQGRNGSRPFIGDIDGDGKADIAYTSYCLFGAFRYNKVTNLFELMFRVKTSDTSAATTMSLFDFNLDGEAELVYRDETLIRIIDKTGSNLASFDCRSGTHTEYPVVADLNRDGHAEIIVSGADPGEYPFGTSANANCRLMVFGSITPGAWAPARKVWNQHAYNATNINEDLSVPQFPMNNAAIFAGPDDVTGTADDVQPFNSFLQQQTILNRDGEPLYKTPDAVFDPTLSSATFTGDSVTITLCVVNQGDAPIGNPLYVTLYRESIAPTNIIVTVDTSLVIQPGDTGYVIIAIPHITPYLPLVNFAARVNDDGVKFTVVQECDSSNNEITILNPAISLMMKKKATLNTVQDNGTYPNPVSVLFSEEITYEITAVNANTVSGDMIITDTLPPYLDLVTGSYIGAFTGAYGTQATIRWEFLNEPPMSSRTVGFKATPVTGAVASQPLFINRAWVKVSDTILVQTNSTYHQGAGVAVVTFSTSLGGWIFNASEQALDYRTSPRPGIQVIPEEGYEFAGWSHDAYTSLRGIIIPADSGIYSYEDVIIHGNVELSANFVSTDRSRYTGTVENEEVTEQKTDKIWAVADNLYVTPFKEGSVLRIYTLEGALREQHTLVTVGTSTYELPRGIYIVTVNKGTGKKIIIHP
ncbi:MAG: T9SS type A sorting domain-containing protein, partial [Tannerella sp.]|nr:T9SS type A sorting domain-containing protein [Tannerella sp.]